MRLKERIEFHANSFRRKSSNIIHHEVQDALRDLGKRILM